jgi:thiamine-phosphate pyrophosphorylase
MPEMTLPRLYCIVDTGCFSSAADLTAAVGAFTRELIAGGATLIQYRNKSGNARQMVADAREIVRVREAYLTDAKVAGQRPTTTGQRLILNDRPDVCLIAGFDGVHIGQDDLSPEAARRIVGTRLWMGVSTHNPEQVAGAGKSSADYVAVGPVYATASKKNPDPVIGLDGVRRARELTRKPLVAIGGITRQNCRAVIDAGADSLAVISDLVDDPRRAVEEFLGILG